MSTCLILVIAIFLASTDAALYPIAVRLPLLGNEAPPGSPWPMPQEWTPSTELLTLDPDSFKFVADVTTCDVINAALEQYKKIIKLSHKARPNTSLRQINSLNIKIENNTCHANYYPSFSSNESYTLNVTASEATLHTKSIWGVRRGLETFSQLLYLQEEQWYTMNATYVNDFPRFQHRGLMIDTARHFLPMPIIIQILDALSFDKFNVLHWHVVDDQSFPYPLRTYPNMTLLGSYSPSHRYSREDVNTILREARLRSIRIIPEFDTPGHTYSWGEGLPDLLTPCWNNSKPYQAVYGKHGERELVNPTQEYTYHVMDAIYKEVIQDFPDEYIHLGMDEAYHRCWQSNPNVTQWMADNNMTSTVELEKYYDKRIIDIAANHGAKYIIWQEPVDQGIEVQSDTLVEVWKDKRNDRRDPNRWQDYAANVTSKGYQILISAPWYLNMIEYGQDWRGFYKAEPHNFTTNTTEQELVKGGEACIWAEYVDGSNIVQRIWPRASAVSERLWSSKDINDDEEAKFRLDQHRCRYNRRGIPAQPILNGFCGDYDIGFPRHQPSTPTPSSPPSVAATTSINTAVIYSIMLASVSRISFL